MEDRSGNTFKFTFADGETDSEQIIDLDRGCFGTIIVAAGSDVIAKTLQIVALPDPRDPDPHPATALLSTAKTLAEGANALSSDEVIEAGAARRALIRLGSSVSEDSKLWLLWKS